ncbi:MAG: alpha/beta hydrolase [Victivallales bacterium]|nr:alpha/beta hydrolase [Victivallales bacterium]
MNEQSGFIPVNSKGPQRAVYATMYLPESLPAKLAVAIVEPLAEEKRAAYRMLVRLARKLAEDGIAAIHFDLSGTGDSTLPHDETTFNAWVDDTIAATEEILTSSQTKQLALVGARGGALVAAKASIETKAQKLILVEPILSGADFLFDLERRQSIKNMMSGSADQSQTPKSQWDEGKSVDFGGYEFNPTLASELSNATMADILLHLEGTTAYHAIRVSASKKLPPAWNIFGENASIVSDKPFWGQLDYYESDFVIDAIRHQL